MFANDYTDRHMADCKRRHASIFIKAESYLQNPNFLILGTYLIIKFNTN